MNLLWSIIVPALVGLLSGVLGTFIAPWVNWGIEKRRQQLLHRKTILEGCRERIASQWVSHLDFMASPDWPYVEPYLDPKVLDCFRKPNHGLSDYSGADAYKMAVNNALIRLAKDWGLT